MDADEELNKIVAAFQDIELTDAFRVHGIVDECYDAGYSLCNVPEDVLRELSSLRVEVLYDLSNLLYDYLKNSPCAEVGAAPLRRPNFLSALHAAKVPLRELLAALAVFLHVGSKARNGSGVTVRGALAASLYFLITTACLGNVPAALHASLGSTMFIAPLFAKSVDMLSLPTSSRPVAPAKKGRGKKAAAPVEAEDADVDGPNVSVECVLDWHEAELSLIKGIAAFLRNLDLDAVPFTMGRITRTLCNVWRRDFPEGDLKWEPSPQLEPLRRKEDAIAKCFSLLLCGAQKREAILANLRTVLWAHMPVLLRLSEDLNSYGPTIPRFAENHAARVEEYVVKVLRHFAEEKDCDDIFECFFDNFFKLVIDSQEYRRRGSATIVRLLDVLPAEVRNEVLQWIVMESEGERIRGRKLAVEVAVCMFAREWQNVKIPYLKAYSPEYVIWTVCCARARDKSAKVRKVAGSALFSVVEKDVNWLNRLRTDDNNAPAHTDPIRSIFPVILEGCSDEYATPRRTFVQLLGKLLVLDPALFDERVKEKLSRCAHDPAKLVRQFAMQVIEDLTGLELGVYCELWIRCVFRLHMDNEASIKEYVIRAFHQKVLEPLLLDGPDEAKKRLAWAILKRILNDDKGDIRLLRQILGEMAKEKLVAKAAVSRLQAYLDGEHKAEAWKLIAELTKILKDVKADFALDFVRAKEFGGDVEDQLGSSAYQIIQSSLKAGKSNAADIADSLIADFPTVRGVATIVEAVRAIYAACVAVEEPIRFDDWARDRLRGTTQELDRLMEDYGNWLRSIAENGEDNSVMISATDAEEDIAFAVRLIGELGQYTGLGKKSSIGDEIRGSDALDLVLQVCDFPTTDNATPIGCRPWVRSHGVFALGRLCLGVKPLTWTRIANIVDLANDNNVDKGLRRDAIVVVFDLLKMFGDVVERHLGKVYSWLSDSCIEIRGDVLDHIQNLLLNEHMQWNPTVFYQFLTSICDPDEKIKENVRTCIRALISKRRNQCYSDFVEALVFLPACTTHPRFKAAKIADEHQAVFPLVGRQNAPKREEIYQFMLKHMSDDQKVKMFERMLEQILMPVVAKEVDIEAASNSRYKDVLLDVFNVLMLKEMEFASLMRSQEDEEDPDVEDEGGEEEPEDAGQKHKKKLSKEEEKKLWEQFKKVIVLHNLLPVLGAIFRQLRNVVRNSSRARQEHDQQLFKACVKLFDHVTKSSQIDLDELSQQTGGSEGQILKSVAIEIKRLEIPPAAAPVRPSAEPATAPPNADDVPLDALLRASPVVMSEDMRPSATPSSAGPPGALHTPQTAEPPRKQPRNAKSPASMGDGSEPESQNGSVKSLRGVLKRNVVAKRELSEASARANPRPKRGTRAKEDEPEEDEKPKTRRETKKKLQFEPASDELDETLKPQSPPKKPSVSRKGSKGGVGSRAISTPNRQDKTMNVTFGSDISAIVSDTTMAQNLRPRRGNK